MNRPRPLALALALPLLLLLASRPAAAELVHHELSVVLEPASHGLQVEDRITLPEPPADGFVELLLNSDFELLESEPPLEAVELGASLERFGINGEVSSEMGLRRWRARAPDGRLRLSYRGRVAYGLSDQKEEYTRGFRSTRGELGPEGVFLSAGTHWYPIVDDGLVTFRVSVEKPKDWHVISQGKGTSGGAEGPAEWDSEGPMDDVYLVGGPLVRYSDQAGAVETFVFLREEDPGLASRYLEATARYMEMYRQLIGPHAYSKFALVENFWETGYGMPSFTLLGSKVIRFPFILTSSYPHEILHDWWGNSVFVDYESGNWCEGLTAYLADHLLKEQQGRAAEYRRSSLQKFRDFVREGRDFPLRDFRSRHDAATEAVGYGKTLMGFHALRLQLGDESFQRFLVTLYRRFQGKRASFGDLQRIAEEVSERDLGRFFDEWTNRTGAPVLELERVRAKERRGRWQVTGRLLQAQEGEPYAIDVALVVQTASGTSEHRLHSEGRSTEIALELDEEPLSLHADPRFDVFRILDARETPPSIGQIFGSPSIVAVLPASASEAEREGYRALAEGWASPNHEVEIVLDTEGSALQGRPGWLFGRDNALAGRYFPKRAQGGEELRFDGESLPFAGHSTVLVTRHPDDEDAALGWITVDPAAALPGMGRKLPHYGKYSYLGFEGEEPSNVVKGQWATTDSPLSIDLRPRRERDEPLPALALEPRGALAELPPAFSASRLKAHVEWLADPAREGRGLGSTGLDEATAWLADRFAEIGLRPGGDDGGWLQRFTVATGPDGTPVETANVIGWLPGSKADFEGQSTIVSAHLDHLGRGWPDVRAGQEGLVHPGADDNASGVAVMLEVARALASAGAPERSIVFIGFSAEEAGRLGSKHWVEHATPLPLEGVRSAINLDTVGRLGEGKIQVIATGTATEWPHLFRGVGFVTGIEFEAVREALESSDQASFIEKGIPAVQLFTGAHADYHSSTDTTEKVDAAGMVKVATFLKESVAYLASRPEPLTATIEGGAKPAAAAPAGGGRRVSFGSVPDFGFPGPGVKLTGVTPGSPAEAAGMTAGDVLLSLDGNEIDSLRAFSNLLKSLQPGQTVRARWSRDGSAMEADVKLAER